jgi:hypothetical protein
LHTLPSGQPLTVREIDVIDLQHNPPRFATQTILSGFNSCSPPVETPEFDLVRYCAPAPVPLPHIQFVDLKLVSRQPLILVG